MEIEAIIRSKYQLLSPTMNERSRRLWVGAGARALARGGIALAQCATGMALNTIHRGLRGLDCVELLVPGRRRRPGWGAQAGDAASARVGGGAGPAGGTPDAGRLKLALALDIRAHGGWRRS